MRTNKEKYKAAFGVLHTSEDFKLEVETMKESKWLNANRFAAKFASVACVLMLCSVTAFAAVKLLTPSDVAHEIGDKKLEAAFESSSAVTVNEAQKYGDYEATLIGMVSGKDLTDNKVSDNEGDFLDDRTYVVTAIQRTDGEKMSFDDSFLVTPLIDGYSPKDINIATLKGGYTEFLSDDETVLYHIADMENIEPLADHKIHLAVQEGAFFDSASNGEIAYDYDANTGEYTRNKNFEGLNALFDLPVDASKADPEKASAILLSAYDDADASDYTVKTWADDLTPENLQDRAKTVKGTKQTVVPDDNGAFNISLQLENGFAIELSDTVENLFPDGEPGISQFFSYSINGDPTEEGEIYVDVFTLNEDGSVTYELWEQK